LLIHVLSFSEPVPLPSFRMQAMSMCKSSDTAASAPPQPPTAHRVDDDDDSPESQDEDAETRKRPYHLRATSPAARKHDRVSNAVQPTQGAAPAAERGILPARRRIVLICNRCHARNLHHDVPDVLKWYADPALPEDKRTAGIGCFTRVLHLPPVCKC
jgi:hypothetical protein